MVRILLISTLLIASSLACAPHKPRRPSRPVAKECPVLTAQWPKAECEAALKVGTTAYVCSAFTGTTTTVTCPAETWQVVAGDSSYASLNSITCDPATGGWVYDNDDKGDLTDATLKSLVGNGPYKFACANPA